MREGWTYKKWSDVLSIINGKNQTAVECKDGKYPIYGSGGIMGYANDWLCPENCVIIGRKGNINKPIFVTTKFWNVDTAFGLNASESSLLPKFLFYFCQDYNFERHNKAVTIPSLTKADLLKIDMPVPSLSEQQSIVAELDKINELISLKKAQLSDLDSLAQSIFYDMFGDPIVNEKGWEVKKWENVFETRTGKLNANAMVEAGAYPFFTCSKDVSYIDTYAFDCEALLLAGNNASAKYDVKYYKGKFNAYQRTYVLTIKEGSYPFFKISLEGKLSFLQTHSLGGLTKYLTMGVLNELSFIFPPLPLQQEFAKRIELIEQQKAQISFTIKDLETLLASRMQYWFD